MTFRITDAFIAEANAPRLAAHQEDFGALSAKLARRGVSIDAITTAVAAFAVALPTWGVGTGGTRFARFPGPGEPRHVFDKLDDCATIHQLTGLTPTVSPHIPWDKVDDLAALKSHATALGLGFDAMNSNTFQDQPGQPHSYKFGSLSHTDPATRAQAIEHNLTCIEIGKVLGSKALTVWIADGANFAGQSSLGRAFDRYLDAMTTIVAAAPDDWRIFIEHKIFEPAFYATVISDWGSSLLAAQALGPKAHCLVDLGHHAPTVNIEQIVARLIHAQKLAGFHFNDSKYGDDDLDSGSVDPFRLFLVFNELIEAERAGAKGFAPAHMIDQSHNVTDPIESLILSSTEIARALAQALLVDRDALTAAQEANDALLAHKTLKDAFITDVSPILAQARMQAGGALDPIATYRASGYRTQKAAERPVTGVVAAGIV
ncbi:MAG: L-rhamnose catabolism isomerase [Pseudomonadota bacterium]